MSTSTTTANPTSSNPGDVTNTRTAPDAGLSREGIIGLCVGIASIIIALLTYFATLKIRKDKKEKEKERKRLAEQAARLAATPQPLHPQTQPYYQGEAGRVQTQYGINPRQEEYNLLDM